MIGYMLMLIDLCTILPRSILLWNSLIAGMLQFTIEEYEHEQVAVGGCYYPLVTQGLMRDRNRHPLTRVLCSCE